MAGINEKSPKKPNEDSDDILNEYGDVSALSFFYSSEVYGAAAASDIIYADLSSQSYTGSGTTTLSFANITNSGRMVASLAAGTATFTVNGITYKDTLTNIQNLTAGTGNANLIGNAQNNILTAGTGNDNLYGYAGDDMLVAGLGNGTLDGGAGNDTASFANITNSGTLTASLGTGTATFTVNGVTYTDKLANIENLTGGLGDAKLVGNAADNIFTIVTSGKDAKRSSNSYQISGGAGSNTVTFTQQGLSQTQVNPESVFVDLSTGYSVAVTSNGNTLGTLKNIQNAIGSSTDYSQNDLRGDANNNILTAGTGNMVTNYLNGAGGFDTLVGSTSNQLPGIIFNKNDLGRTEFDFTSTLDSTKNLASVQNFLSSDYIGLDDAVFTAWTKAGLGQVSPSQLTRGTSWAGASSSTRLFYNTGTGELYYTADGTQANAVEFAVLQVAPTLNTSNFKII